MPNCAVFEIGKRPIADWCQASAEEMRSEGTEMLCQYLFNKPTTDQIYSKVKPE